MKKFISLKFVPKISTITENIFRFKERIKIYSLNFIKIFTQYIENLSLYSRSRFVALMWGYNIIFIGICILSNSNPFRLLVPGFVFPKPIRDIRKPVDLIGISATGDKYLTFKRKLFIDGSIEGDVRRLALLISRPPGLQESTLYDLKPLPGLGLSIRRVWLIKDSSKSRLIIDLSRRILLEVHKEFMRDRNKKKAGKSLAFLDEYFQSLTSSILMVKKDVTTVSFLLNGKTEAIPGMKFDLSKSYTFAGGVIGESEK